MADHPAYTPAEIERALAAYLATGSFSAAARAIGRDRLAVTRALKRHTSDSIRAQVYARALEAEEQRALAAVRLGRAKVAAALEADDGSRSAELARAANDALRAVAQTRSAHAKLVGSHAPEKVEVSATETEELAAMLRRALHGDGG